MVVIEDPRLFPPRSEGEEEEGGVETAPVVVPSEIMDVTETPVTETKRGINIDEFLLSFSK